MAVGNETARPLALVTGASSGIGLALARQFAGHGFDVAVVAEEEQIFSAAQSVTQPDADVIPYRFDLATRPGVDAFYQEVRELGRPVEAAALNAGTGVHGRFDETSLDDDLALVDLNCRSTVHLAKLLTRDMVARGHGRLLIVSSIAAKAPGPYHATYAASKAFAHSFAEAIREELSGTGVTVTSLLPGPTDTKFFERADMEDTQVATGRKDDPDDVARDGYEAMMTGKAHVVAGSFKNKVQAEASRLVPTKTAAKFQASETRPGSGNGSD